MVIIRGNLLPTLLFLFLLIGKIPAGEVTHAGIRTSRYGINPYPEPIGWHHAIYTMNTYFPGTIPAAIWTTGVIWDPGECHLYFPNDQGYPTDSISYTTSDLNEDYLDYFDEVGIKVYLQIEPGDVDIKTLIDMVLERYGNHSCVVGFGVDVEWYQCADNEWGKKISDTLAQTWEGWVKAHNSSYNLFLKHPDRTPTRFPETYRGKIVFVNDCEGLDSINGNKGFDDYENDFLGVMETFASYFYPNPVLYQIGYPSIDELWQEFDPKPKVIGEDLVKICGNDQDVGVFWVDFGMDGVLPHDNDWDPLDWTIDIITQDYNNGKNVFVLNPYEKANLIIFSLNGRVLQSIYGYGKEISTYITRGNRSSYNNNGMVIYWIKQGEKCVTTKNMTIK